MSNRTRSTAQRTIFPLIMIGVGIILILAVVIWSLTSQNKSAVNANPTTDISEATIAAIPRIALSEAKTAYDSGTAVFIDVRSADSYATEHVKGAISIPLADLPAQLNQISKDQKIITYCT